MNSDPFKAISRVIYPIIIATLCFLGFIVLISGFSGIPVMLHRVWIIQEYQFPSLAIISLVLTLLLWVPFTILQGIKPIYIVPVGLILCLSYFSYIFLGLAALGGAVISLVKFRINQQYLIFHTNFPFCFI